jgi:hypothetical protein
MERLAEIFEAGVARVDLVGTNLRALPATPAILAAMDHVFGDLIAEARRRRAGHPLDMFLRHTGLERVPGQ